MVVIGHAEFNTIGSRYGTGHIENTARARVINNGKLSLFPYEILALLNSLSIYLTQMTVVVAAVDLNVLSQTVSLLNYECQCSLFIVSNGQGMGS